MSHRIDHVFATAAERGRRILIPFITAGDPDPAWTVPIMHALVAGGADLIELGVPFSDPMADGPVIQASSERAIARGVDLAGVLEMVRAFRADDVDTPVVLMGYMNPVERFGVDALAGAFRSAGVDGLLMVDCPPEELVALQPALDAAGAYAVLLVAPTTTEHRLQRIARAARGFIYYVSFKGITGAGRLDTAALQEPLARIRRHSQLPVAVGFGIKDPAAAAAVAQHADAVVIGSALVENLVGSDAAEEACGRAREFVASMRASLDNMAGSK